MLGREVPPLAMLVSSVPFFKTNSPSRRVVWRTPNERLPDPWALGLRAGSVGTADVFLTADELGLRQAPRTPWLLLWRMMAVGGGCVGRGEGRQLARLEEPTACVVPTCAAQL